ncbi:MAG: hypothetical protein LW808_003840 [Verrucomicrobiota bacterium]|nr:MAG: hypothetical protein LW808_003840 [Verrucomicrobiota bacterium]
MMPFANYEAPQYAYHNAADADLDPFLQVDTQETPPIQPNFGRQHYPNKSENWHEKTTTLPQQNRFWSRLRNRWYSGRETTAAENLAAENGSQNRGTQNYFKDAQYPQSNRAFMQSETTKSSQVAKPSGFWNRFRNNTKPPQNKISDTPFTSNEPNNPLSVPEHNNLQAAAPSLEVSTEQSPNLWNRFKNGITSRYYRTSTPDISDRHRDSVADVTQNSSQLSTPQKVQSKGFFGLWNRHKSREPHARDEASDTSVATNPQRTSIPNSTQSNSQLTGITWRLSKDGTLTPINGAHNTHSVVLQSDNPASNLGQNSLHKQSFSEVNNPTDFYFDAKNPADASKNLFLQVSDYVDQMDFRHGLQMGELDKLEGLLEQAASSAKTLYPSLSFFRKDFQTYHGQQFAGPYWMSCNLAIRTVQSMKRDLGMINKSLSRITRNGIFNYNPNTDRSNKEIKKARKAVCKSIRRGLKDYNYSKQENGTFAVQDVRKFIIKQILQFALLHLTSDKTFYEQMIINNPVQLVQWMVSVLQQGILLHKGHILGNFSWHMHGILMQAYGVGNNEPFTGSSKPIYSQWSAPDAIDAAAFGPYVTWRQGTAWGNELDPRLLLMKFASLSPSFPQEKGFSELTIKPEDLDVIANNTKYNDIEVIAENVRKGLILCITQVLNAFIDQAQTQDALRHYEPCCVLVDDGCYERFAQNSSQSFSKNGFKESILYRDSPNLMQLRLIIPECLQQVLRQKIDELRFSTPAYFDYAEVLQILDQQTKPISIARLLRPSTREIAFYPKAMKSLPGIYDYNALIEKNTDNNMDPDSFERSKRYAQEIWNKLWNCMITRDANGIGSLRIIMPDPSLAKLFGFIRKRDDLQPSATPGIWGRIRGSFQRGDRTLDLL